MQLSRARYKFSLVLKNPQLPYGHSLSIGCDAAFGQPLLQSLDSAIFAVTAKQDLHLSFLALCKHISKPVALGAFLLINKG